MLSFANATGNLFNRLGKCGLLIKQMKSYQSSQLTNMTDTTNGIVAQFASESDIQSLIGNAYIGQLTTPEAVAGLAQRVAIATVNRMTFRDNPKLNQTLTQTNTIVALQEIIRQMKIANATVLAMTVTTTPSVFTGTGNGVINASATRPFDGKVLENAYAENILLTCVADSYTGGATAGNETFSVTGAGNQTDTFAFNWPLGSNCNSSLTAIDGDTSNGSNNVLNNSNFATWSGGLPSGWTAPVTNGSDITQNSSITYGSGSSVQLTGDGVTLTQLNQLFNSSTGTTGTLTAVNAYSDCIFLRRDGTASAQGTLTIDLVDGNNNVILDNNGVANTYNIDLTALTTTFTGYLGNFRLPTIMPSAYSIRYRLSTALTNGRSVYLAKSSLGLATQAYTSGPFVAVHAGANPFVLNDYGTVAVTNSRGSGGTLSTFQTLMAQLFPNEVYANELLFPSSAAPSIGDALIG